MLMPLNRHELLSNLDYYKKQIETLEEMSGYKIEELTLLFLNNQVMINHKKKR